MYNISSAWFAVAFAFFLKLGVSSAEDEGPPHDPVMGNYSFEPVSGFIPETEVPFTERLQCGAGLYEHPWLKLSVEEIIKSSGYEFESHSVLSKDGYYVTTYRIPGGALSPKKEGKIPVILNHGSYGYSMSWLFFMGNDSLAFKLANSGYDVYLMNAHGTLPSQEHKTLKKDDPKFWDFTFEEMAIYDIPALMDHITNITGQESMYYIGHSQATIQYAIMLSMKPELANKIRVGFLLAPALHIGGMSNRAFKFMLNIPTYETIWYALYGRYMGEPFLERLLASVCILPVDCHLCENLILYFLGYNAKQVNGSTAVLARDRFFSMSGTKVIIHLAQIYQYDRFQRYDFGAGWNMVKYDDYNPPEYPVEKITAPTVMWWGYSDSMVVKEDAKRTYLKFSPGVIKENNRVQAESWGHMDFLYGKDANPLIYDRILGLMDNKKYVGESGESGKTEGGWISNLYSWLGLG